MLDMDPRPLTDETVKKLMSEKRNIMALPGGFVEAAGVTTSTELIYLGKLPYWMHRCRSSGYTLRISLIYEGSRFYDQSDIGTSTRLMLAKHDIPCVVPVPTVRKPTLFVRTMDVNLDWTMNEVVEMIQTNYTIDVQMIKHKYGVDCKPVRIISKL